MNLANILKIAGLIMALFLVSLVVVYFLYPYLNEEKYEEVISEFSETEPVVQGDREYIGKELENLNEQLDSLRKKEIEFERMIDSLKSVNEDLRSQINEDEELTQTGNDRNNEEDQTTRTDDQTLLAGYEVEEEEFSERVKSLLNLDEGELAPIVNQMSKQELVRLYKGGGSIQREKLLRSLDPERAAELMKEIML